MKQPDFQQYIVNASTEEVGEIRETISKSLAMRIADRAFISLTISGIIDGLPSTHDVSFQPIRVESDDSFISWGVLRDGDSESEASIRDEDNGKYLIVDAALHSSRDDQLPPVA